MLASILAVAAALLLVWAILIAVVWWRRPNDTTVADGMRIPPDTIRLVSRLARDATVGRSTRIRLWLLLGYLAFPIDLVPDFIPVIGHADDLIITAIVLRSVIHHADPGILERAWPGTPAGLQLLRSLCRIDPTHL